MSQGLRVKVPVQQRLLIHSVDWQGYQRFLRAFAERPGYRLTYDRGTLEIMDVSFEHGSESYLVGRLVDVLTDELDLPVAGGRDTTFKRRKKLRGLEPDNCYWLAHEIAVRGKKRIDLRVDPPPDLTIEVEVTRSVLNRMGIYAALGVPEVWRFDGKTLGFYLLNAKGKYVLSTSSPNFPGLKSDDLVRFLALQGQMDQTALVRQFRDWVRQQIAAGVLRRPGA